MACLFIFGEKNSCLVVHNLGRVVEKSENVSDCINKCMHVNVKMLYLYGAL
jgi:hypothetical protein